MTGMSRKLLCAVLACSTLAACGGGAEPTTPVATASTEAKDEPDLALGGGAGATPAATGAASEDGVLQPRPAGSEPATPSDDAQPSPAPAGPAGGDVARPDLGGVEDRSGVARELEVVPGDIPPDAILVEEDFDTTTPAVEAVDGPRGVGGIGNLGSETYFYELVPATADAHLAAPILRIPQPDSASVYVQGTNFIQSFAGDPQADRGWYCWAADGNDPLAGSRYEMLVDPDGRVQVVRYGADGQPEALVLDEVWDAAAANEEDPEAPDTPASTLITGLLCRPTDDGHAQIAVRVERDYWVTTDDGGPEPGGGVGMVVAGSGSGAPDTIATYGVLFVIDGHRVPFL